MISILKHFSKFSVGPPVSIYQNLYASKPALRNLPKTENFRSYESIGNIKQPIWREQHPTEKTLGPIQTLDDSAKDGPYKNPEYYSYHNYSFYNLTMALQCTYQPQPSALEEQVLPEVTTKKCYQVLPPEKKPWDDGGAGSGKKNPPPRCGEEEQCGKDKSRRVNQVEKTVCEEVKAEAEPKCDGDEVEPKK